MAQGSLVEMQINDGAKIIDKLRESAFDVMAAWWMKASEEGLWYLYIASKEVDEHGIAAAYRKFHSLMAALGPLWVDRFDVKLVGAENPVAKDVVDIVTRFPGRIATRYGGKRLGNVSIDDSYIYPAVVTA